MNTYITIISLYENLKTTLSPSLKQNFHAKCCLFFLWIGFFCLVELDGEEVKEDLSAEKDVKEEYPMVEVSVITNGERDE